MLRTKDILDEKDPRVRAENTDVEFPLSLEYKNIINNLSLEKRYNENFYQKTGISIYQTIKSIE